MTMRHASPAALALALTALLPATAAARLPTPKSTTIVPGKSIGGVSPGMSVGRALGIWGPGSDCTAISVRVRCTWAGPGKQGAAFFEVGTDGKIAQVVIEAGQRTDGTPAYTGPLLHWRTRKKIHLGQSLATVYKAYPKLVGSGSGAQLGSGTHATTFVSSLGHTYSIIIGPIL